MPPSPSSTLDPARIEVVTEVDESASPFLVTLASGEILHFDEIGGRRQIYRWGNLEPGVLLLTGPGDPAAWYTWLVTRGTAAQGQSPREADCWEIRGGAFDEGSFVHFSSGLRLPKAPDFHLAQTWIHEDPFPARESDVMCVDRAGVVTQMVYLFQPY